MLRLTGILRLRHLCAFAALTFVTGGTIRGQEPGPADPDPRAAVLMVSRSFAPNPLSQVDGTHLPLPGTGSWGAQTKFAEGTPAACRAARLPCVRVWYRVPEAKLACSWLVAYVVVADIRNGEVLHKTMAILLDEDASASRYTMQIAWSSSEQAPQPVTAEAPDYPAIAAPLHLGGTVGVRVVVGTDGKVKSVLSTSGPKLLAASAAETVRKWAYEPVTVGSVPTSFQRDIFFDFQGGAPAQYKQYGGGGVMLLNADPHVNSGIGFRMEGATGTSFETCNAVSCTYGK